MRSVVSIVGKSESGKTTLIECLIAEFKRRGYRIATIKHSRRDMEIDQPGKDSWRFTQAGSDTTVIACLNRVALTKKVEHDLSIDEILHLIGGDFDLILTEGFKTGKAHKIEVHREEQGKDLVCHWRELSAVVSDGTTDFDVPKFAPDDITAIADFIEKKLTPPPEEQVSLFVNDTSVPMNPFIKQLVINVAVAIASPLKGIGKIRKLEISVRRNPEG